MISSRPRVEVSLKAPSDEDDRDAWDWTRKWISGPGWGSRGSPHLAAVRAIVMQVRMRAGFLMLLLPAHDEESGREVAGPEPILDEGEGAEYLDGQALHGVSCLRKTSSGGGVGHLSDW